MHPVFSRCIVATVVAFLTLHGATAMASAKTLTWAGCGISKKAFMDEMAAAYEQKTGVKIDLKGGGATRGIREVSDLSRNIGGSCRHVIEDPRTLLPHQAERRIRLDPVAWDALVVITHNSNPVNDISLHQIRDVFLGKITNWKELGGHDAPIDVYVRKGKISGVGRTVRELIFADYEQEFTPRAKVMDSSGPLEKAMEAEAVNGIGITGVSSARKRDVKILNLEGKAPTYENIKDGNYLLYRPLYLITHLSNKDLDVRNFVTFVHSEEGKQIMRKVGTVPYDDAIHLWLKYLTQMKRAQDAGLVN